MPRKEYRDRFKEILSEADKERYRKQQEEKKAKIMRSQILDAQNFPVESNECIKFRYEVTGYSEVSDPFFKANHHTSCKNCNAWFHQWKFSAKGANPW